MDRAADLLVEERVPGELGHGLVQAERKLPGAAGALVERQHLAQERLTFLGVRADDLAAAELEPHAAHRRPA